MTESATVFIVDDDPAVLRGLKRLLSAEGFEVQTHVSAASLLNNYEGSMAGCFIIDLTLPDMNGLELTRKLAELATEPAVVFLTGTGDIHTSVQAMKEGAIDFLTKPVEIEDLIPAVKAAIKKDQKSREEHADLKILEERYETLSQREKEVFEHVVQGNPNKIIARDLGVVEKTIKVHRARVIRKMAALSLAELVRMSERLRIGQRHQ
jgi:FixJ family two-component response regulator